MNVLMFGWEFPPFSYGGLGTACKGIVDGLLHHQVNLTLVLPQAQASSGGKLNIMPIDDFVKSHKISEKELLKMVSVDANLTPYDTAMTYTERLQEMQRQREHQESVVGDGATKMHYGDNLFQEIQRYASKAYHVGKTHQHDLIHAHDWLTMPAGAAAKRASGKALVSHVHATEFDRTGGNPNQNVYDIERAGMEASDRIIAVSEFTKQKIIEHYGISADKISVVHNAVSKEKAYFKNRPHIDKKDHVVLFLGRLTLQKGPEYFLQMAQQVLKYEPNTKFVMAGNGDMMHRMIHLSAQLGIAKNVLFSGYLKGAEIDHAYANADLYVMPSVSEPFGITPLEAIRNGTPVLISKQSGVSEVIRNALRVDFWDIDDMANKTLSVIRYKKLKQSLARESQSELQHMSWVKQAKHIQNVYHHVVKP